MAGGIGKRMKSDLPKVLLQLAGKPLVHYVIDLARKVGSDRIILVVGYKRELVKETTRDLGVEWAVQERQLGTADAVKSCEPLLRDYDGDILILSGDVPLLRPESVAEALGLHRQSSAALTGFTFIPEDPTGYGRIIRGREGEFLKIVEEKDATEDNLKVNEVNGGIYLFRASELRRSLPMVTNDNASREYYLTDTISILDNLGEKISAYLVEDPMEMAGINSREQMILLESEFLRHKQS